MEWRLGQEDEALPYPWGPYFCTVLRTQRRHAGIVLHMSRLLLRRLAMWGTCTYDYGNWKYQMDGVSHYKRTRLLFRLHRYIRRKLKKDTTIRGGYAFLAVELNKGYLYQFGIPSEPCRIHCWWRCSICHALISKWNWGFQRSVIAPPRCSACPHADPWRLRAVRR